MCADTHQYLALPMELDLMREWIQEGGGAGEGSHPHHVHGRQMPWTSFKYENCGVQAN